MFKVFSRYLREHLERNVINQKEKVDNATKKQQNCYCKYNSSFFSDYLKKINKRFGGRCKRAVVSLKEQTHQENKNDTFTTNDYLRESWIEALGWSGTLAFGWALSQNFHRFRRRKSAEDFLKYTQIQPYGIPRKSLCPHQIFKSVLVHSVLAQPNDLIEVKSLVNGEVKSLVNTEKVHTSSAELPVFGPKTAEETWNEVGEGLRKAHNNAIGELENRLGLRCMDKQRYRKAVLHFAAGSALQNSSATFNLAQCYELGLGTSQDFVKAAKFYRTASDLGNASATYNLAVFYAHGYGGLKCDRNKALQLLEKAVQLGDTNAEKLLKQFVSKTSKSVFPRSVEPEMNDSVCRSTEENAIRTASPVSKPSRILFQLPFSKVKGNLVTMNKKRGSMESNSASTDDGLASELDSSTSVDSRSGSSCNSDLSIDSSSGESYGCSRSTSNVNSGSMDLRVTNICGKSEENGSSPKYGYPVPLLMEIYKLVTVPGH